MKRARTGRGCGILGGLRSEAGLNVADSVPESRDTERSSKPGWDQNRDRDRDGIDVADSVPESMDTERASGWGRPRNQDPVDLDTHPAPISTGTVRATSTRPSSRWTQGELQVEIEIGIGIDVADSVPESMDTERASGWGRPRNQDPVDLDTHPAPISTGTVRATSTRSPSRWTRRELQVGVDLEIAVETTSTLTPRPSARGPCGPHWGRLAPLRPSGYIGTAWP